MDSQRILRIVRLYFSLAVIEGIALMAVGLLTAGRNPLSWSPALSLPLLLLFLISLLLCAGFAWLARQHPARILPIVQRVSIWLSREPVYWGLVFLLAVGSASALYFLPVSFNISSSFVELCIVYILTPYLLWFALLGIQTLVSVRVLRHGLSLSAFASERGILRTFAVALGMILLIVLLIALTGIGLHPDPVDWGVPGVPLLASQVLLGAALAFVLVAVGKLVILAWKRLRPQDGLKAREFAVDALICLLLWAGAVWLWNAQPLKASWFNPKPRLPAQEYFPYSDSIHYDMSAQRLLLGRGFEPDVIRPVYSGFLALAQAVSGISYESVIKWQVMVLALISPLLYLLGKTLHHRLSGILVGLLSIFHEMNSLQLAGQIDVSNSKMYMSDLPAQLGVILFCLFTAAWLKAPQEKKASPFLAGGFLGICLLVRTQIVLILPVLPVLGWLAFRRRPALWLQGSLLLVAGMAASLLPWNIRSLTTVNSVLSDPEPSGVIFRFDDFIAEDVAPQPGETRAEYDGRRRELILDGLLAQPLRTFNVISGHYVNNHIASLFVLPTSYPLPAAFGGAAYNPCSGLFWLSFWEQCCSVNSYVRSVPYWSGEWDMDFSAIWLPVTVTLLLVGLGVAVSWEQARMAAVAPLLIAFLYNWGNAGTRLSGWRFNLPVDWVGMLFYTVGLVQVLFWVGMLFSNRRIPAAAPVGVETVPAPLPGETGFPWKTVALAGALFFLFTASLPVAERVIEDRYAGLTVEAVIDDLDEEGLLAAAGIDRDALERMLAEDGAEAYIGRALYPRHYPANRGELSVRWPVYLVRDYPRLGFMLAPDKVQVILPLRKAPEYFPNAADVFVMGCRIGEDLEEGYLQAYLVAFLDEPGDILVGQQVEQWSCASP